MKLFLKILLTCIFITILSITIDWYGVILIIEDISWGVILLTITLQLVIFFIATIRWRQILLTHNIRFSVINLYPYFLIATFFNNFLPSTVGGDFYRMYFIHANIKEIIPSVLPVLFDRFIGLICLIGMGVVAIMCISIQNELISVFFYFMVGILSTIIFLISLIINLKSYKYICVFLYKFENNKTSDQKKATVSKSTVSVSVVLLWRIPALFREGFFSAEGQKKWTQNALIKNEVKTLSRKKFGGFDNYGEFPLIS